MPFLPCRGYLRRLTLRTSMSQAIGRVVEPVVTHMLPTRMPTPPTRRSSLEVKLSFERRSVPKTVMTELTMAALMLGDFEMLLVRFGRPKLLLVAWEPFRSGYVVGTVVLTQIMWLSIVSITVPVGLLYRPLTTPGWNPAIGNRFPGQSTPATALATRMTSLSKSDARLVSV